MTTPCYQRPTCTATVRSADGARSPASGAEAARLAWAGGMTVLRPDGDGGPHPARGRARGRSPRERLAWLAAESRAILSGVGEAGPRAARPRRPARPGGAARPLRGARGRGHGAPLRRGALPGGGGPRGLPPARRRRPAARARAQRHHPGHAGLRRPGGPLLAPGGGARRAGCRPSGETGPGGAGPAATWRRCARRSSPSTGWRGGTRERPSIAIVARPGDAQIGELRRLRGPLPADGARGASARPRRVPTRTRHDLLYRHVWAHRTPPGSPFARALREPARYAARQPGERDARGQGPLRAPLRVRRGRRAGRAGRARRGRARRRAAPALDPAALDAALVPRLLAERERLRPEAELGLRRQERPPRRRD